MSMISSPVGIDSIPTVALEFVTAFGADLVCFRHAPSLTLLSDLWKFKLHHYQCRGSLSQFGAENQLLTSGRCAHRDHFAHRWGGSSERAHRAALRQYLRTLRPIDFPCLQTAKFLP